METETVKGFSDYMGEEAEKREKIKEIIVRNFKLYGFSPVETPIIEEEKFVKGENEFDEAVSDVFKLKDKGKRKLALRYEFTFQLKRLVENKKLPYKRYQIGEVFRDEPTKQGRYRQFVQCDADIIGSSEIVADAEILALTKKIFQELKIPIMIEINNRQLLNNIIESLGTRDKKTETEIIKQIDKLEKNREEAYKNLQKLLGKEKTEKLLEYFNKPLEFFIKQGFSGASDLKELKRLCQIYSIKTSFKPGLARGLLYYTGNVFEVKNPKYEFTIAAGGRYNINGLASIGISFGLDRIADLAKVEIKKKEVLIISIGEDDKSIKLVEKLRSKGIACSLMYGKIFKALEYANSYKIPYVIFLGKEEVKKKKVKLRDMKTGKEVLVEEKKLVERLSEKDKNLFGVDKWLKGKKIKISKLREHHDRF